MKTRNKFLKSLGFFVFVMIGIMTFVKGNTGQLLQIVAFSIWALYIVFSYGLVHIKNITEFIKTKKSVKTVYSNIPVNNVNDENLKNIINTLLSENVSDKLTSVFPDCKWSFKDNTASFIDSGETTILTENADGYEKASISINKSRVDLMMIKTTSLNSLKQDKSNQQSVKQNDDIDIYSWFSNIGQQKLKEIATDLATKDCNEFKIREDGSVFIIENDNETKTTTINSIPPKSQWNSIIPLIKDIGFLGYVENNELIISL